MATLALSDSLTDLSLSRNVLGAEGSRALAELLDRSKQLRILDASSTCLKLGPSFNESQHGASWSLAAAFGRSSLKTIRLADNALCRETKLLVDALRSSGVAHGRVIDLRENRLSMTEAEHLSGLVHTNEGGSERSLIVESLDLRGNELTSAGAALARLSDAGVALCVDHSFAKEGSDWSVPAVAPAMARSAASVTEDNLDRPQTGSVIGHVRLQNSQPWYNGILSSRHSAALQEENRQLRSRLASLS